MKNTFYKMTLAVVALAITAYYFLYNPAEKSIFPPCVFRTITGYYCGGCGGQRAFHSFLHGNLALAFKQNLLIFLVLPMVILKISEEVFERKMIPSFIISKNFLIVLSIFVLLFWILRNLPFHVFEIFRP